MRWSLPVRLFIKRFRDAGRGLWLLYLDPSFRLDLKLGGVAVVAGLVFQITATQWALLVIVIGVVLKAEAFNTVQELQADFKQKPAAPPWLHYDPDIRDIKDISAGGVLIVSISAAIVGTIIFVPYINHVL